MLLEVTRELHGEPFGAQNAPRLKEIKLDFIPPCPGTIFGTFTKGKLEKNHRLYAIAWVIFYRCLLMFGCVFVAELLGLLVNLGNSDFATCSM